MSDESVVMSNDRASTPSFTLTWNDPDDAESVALVLIEAGTHGAQVTDRGFYDDGRSLMEQVDQWRAARREPSTHCEDICMDRCIGACGV